MSATIKMEEEKMKKLSKTLLKKYISAIKKEKKKVMTCEDLSNYIGVYPEVIAEYLSYFDPMVPMDMFYNIKDLLSDLEKELAILEEEAPKVVKPVRITKKEIDKYGSIATFVYEKMTTGGLVDRNVTLSDKDLRLLKKLITLEEKERKKGKKK